MSLFTVRDECPVCFKLTGYAGMRARQSELRKHLACECDEQLTEVRGDPLPNDFNRSKAA